jgi:hypothetical protein
VSQLFFIFHRTDHLALSANWIRFYVAVVLLMK